MLTVVLYRSASHIAGTRARKAIGTPVLSQKIQTKADTTAVPTRIASTPVTTDIRGRRHSTSSKRSQSVTPSSAEAPLRTAMRPNVFQTGASVTSAKYAVARMAAQQAPAATAAIRRARSIGSRSTARSREWVRIATVTTADAVLTSITQAPSATEAPVATFIKKLNMPSMIRWNARSRRPHRCTARSQMIATAAAGHTSETSPPARRVARPARIDNPYASGNATKYVADRSTRPIAPILT